MIPMGRSDVEPQEGCYACWSSNGGYECRHGIGGLFIDSRTGRGYCAEHVIALASFELDAHANGDDTDPDLAEQYHEQAYYCSHPFSHCWACERTHVECINSGACGRCHDKSIASRA